MSKIANQNANLSARGDLGRSSEFAAAKITSLKKFKQSKVQGESHSAPTSSPELSLDHLVGYHLRRAEIHMRQQILRVMTDWDIHPGAYSVLLLVAQSQSQNQTITQTAVAQALNIKRPNLVSLVARLEQQNFLHRTVSPEDRRNHHLSITEKGEALLDEMAQPMANADAQIGQCWNEAERQTLITLLKRFYSNSNSFV